MHAIPSIHQLKETEPTSAAVSLVEQELIDCIRRKKEVDRLLIDLEVQLYNYETFYLEKYAAATGGNLVKGFDPAVFMAAIPPPTQGPTLIPDEHRIFSNSSLSTQKALQIKNKNAPPPFASPANARSSALTFGPGRREGAITSASARRRNGIDVSNSVTGNRRRKKHAHKAHSGRKSLRGASGPRGYTRRSTTVPRSLGNEEDMTERQLLEDDEENDHDGIEHLEPEPDYDEEEQEEAYREQRSSAPRKKKRIVRSRSIQEDD